MGPRPTFEEKVEFLRQPENYPEPTRGVEVVETHMSRVFLTDHHAYKMKRPITLEYLDFSTLDRRRADCRREVRLNRRLAEDVYLGVIALRVGDDGQGSLGGSGTPVEWLVKMVRLPADRMMDHRLREGSLDRREVVPAARKLARFYRSSDPVVRSPGHFLDRLAGYVRENQHALRNPRYELPDERVDPPLRYLFSFLDDKRPLLVDRVESGRVLEGHGDLRPQHICLVDPPVIFDCLEFKREYREVDPIDELAYLRLECDRLGRPEAGNWFRRVYREYGEDPYSRTLDDFYYVYRATLRAKLAAWHLRDNHVDDHRGWLRRAREYLDLANRAVDSPGYASP